MCPIATSGSSPGRSGSSSASRSWSSSRCASTPSGGASRACATCRRSCWQPPASSLILAALLSSWRPDDLVPVPRGVLAFNFLLTLVLVGGARFAVRSVIERPPRSELVSSGKEVLICGAGDAGVTLLREMKRNRSLGYTPVGLIDDDPRKRRLRVQGTRVRGARADLPRILREAHVDEVIIAMPSAPGRVREEIVQSCRRAGVPCTTLPGLPELITGDVTVSLLREVRVEDVLGRAAIEVDFARVARYLNGRSVLVTGAGGSIGARALPPGLGHRRAAPGDGRPLREQPVRDRPRAARARPRRAAGAADRRLQGRAAHGAHLRAERPEIVFHAAAYKHVPMMELNPVAGDRQQRARHRDPRRPGRALRRRAVLPDLHRQGRRAQDRDGRLEGAGRADRGGARRVLATPASPPCASATCSAAPARCCRSSGARSPRAGRSR